MNLNSSISCKTNSSLTIRTHPRLIRLEKIIQIHELDVIASTLASIYTATVISVILKTYVNHLTIRSRSTFVYTWKLVVDLAFVIVINIMFVLIYFSENFQNSLTLEIL